MEFANAIVGADRAALDDARADLSRVLGPGSVSAAAAIAANFTKNDRIANGCGIPSELRMLKNSKAIRGELGLNNYRSAENTRRCYPDEM